MEDFEEFVEGYNETVDAFGVEMADEIYNDILSTVIGEDLDINDVLLSEGTPLGNGMPTSVYEKWNKLINGGMEASSAANSSGEGFLNGIFGKLKGLWGTVAGSKLFSLLKKGPMFVLNHPFLVLGIAGGAFLVKKLYNMMVNSGNIDQYPQLQKAEDRIERQQNEDYAGNDNGVADLFYEAKRNRFVREIVKEEFEVSDKYIDSTKTCKDLLDY